MNALTPLLGFIDLAISALPPEHAARHFLEHARRSGRRALDLVEARRADRAAPTAPIEGRGAGAPAAHRGSNA